MHASIACVRTLPWSGEDVSFLIKLPAEWVLLRHCVRRPHIKLLDLVVLVRTREPSFCSLTFRLTFEEIQVFQILLLLLLLVSLFHCFFLSWPLFIFLVENEVPTVSLSFGRWAPKSPLFFFRTVTPSFVGRMRVIGAEVIFNVEVACPLAFNILRLKFRAHGIVVNFGNLTVFRWSSDD